MPVILHHGVMASRRTIEDRLRGPVFDDLIIIVPTRRRIRHLVREVMALTGKPVTPAFPFFTLESFAQSVFAATDVPARIVAGPIQTLLFHRAIRSLGGELEYFIPHGRDARMFPGTFEKIVEVILHLKESGVTAGLLAEEAAAAPLDERHKLRDIAAIYEGYERLLASLHAVDVPGIFAHLQRECSPAAFAEIFRRLYPRADLLSLAGFDEFTEPETALIQHLCGVAGLGVTLLFDYQQGNPALFGHLESNYRRFREMGFVPVHEEAEPERRLFPINTMWRSAKSREAARVLARTLFLPGRLSDRADLSGAVTLITASSRRHEVEMICKLIKELAAENPGSDLSSICVALLQPQVYTDLFREECARFGIPVNITDRFQLSRSPLVTLILALLRMQIAGFRRDDVLRVAGTPYFHLGPPSSPVDAANLAEVSRELRITGGYQSWLTRIRRRIEDDRCMAAAAGTDTERARRERSARAMEKAESDLQVLGATTHELAGECVPAEFRRRFLRLLDRLDVARNLVTLSADGAAEVVERDVRAYAKFLEVLGETTELLAFQDGPAATHTVKNYVEQLTAAILRERYNVREQFGRGVLITSIDETRGLSTNVMIVAGLVDGEFPSVYQPEVFLSTERRTKREQRFLWQNRYLFYQAVTNWVSHLYLTTPKREGDIDLVRSSFVDALLNVVQVEEWRAGENIPFEHTLASEDEVLRWYGSGEEPVADSSGLPEHIPEKLGEVRRAVAVERSRTALHDLPEYEGILPGRLSDDAQLVLSGLRSDVFSVTQLETYGQCPFRFFVRRLLRLDAPGEFEEGLTPIERGSILHDALFEFFTLRREKGLPSVPLCTDEQFEEALAELTRIVDSRLSALEIPDAFWDLDRELLLGPPTGGRGLVREFLEAERKRTVQSKPLYFEVGFGGPDPRTDAILSTPEPVVLGDIRLRGKVDRVEVGDEFFTIVDYKTGATLPGIDDIRSGMSLQLPLYLRVVEQLLESAFGRRLQPAGGLYYRLRSPIKVTAGLADAAYNKIAFTSSANSRQVLRSGTEFQDVLDGAVRSATGSVAAMVEGRFPLTSPENIEKVCTYCDYKTICRIQTVRHVHPTAPEEA